MPLYPQALDLIKADLLDKLEAAANEAAVVTMEHLQEPGHGRQHAGLPRRSSAPTEYPAEQSGALVNSIDAQAGTGLTFTFGSFRAPPEAYWLEFKPPGAPGFPRKTNIGVRRWLSRSAEDPITHVRMLEAIKRS